jgi:hypothetical protein
MMTEQEEEVKQSEKVAKWVNPQSTIALISVAIFIIRKVLQIVFGG